MKWIVECSDCGWTFQHEDQVEAADALERHARKERHHVDIHRTATISS